MWYDLENVSSQLIRQLTEKRQGRCHLSGGTYSGPARLVSQSKEISNDQESIQSKVGMKSLRN